VPAVLSLDPPVVNQPAGATFTVNVIINGGQNVYSVPVQISYDTKLLQVINVSNAGGLSRDGAAVSLVQRNDVEHGLIQVSMLRPPGAPGITPQGAIFSITFQAKAAGQATVAIGPTVLKDPNQGPVPAVGSQAIVTIR
jgi:general secretion pathway protein D